MRRVEDGPFGALEFLEGEQFFFVHPGQGGQLADPLGFRAFEQGRRDARTFLKLQ